MKPILAVTLIIPILCSPPAWADAAGDIRALKKTIATLQKNQKSQDRKLAELSAVKKRLAKVEGGAAAAGNTAGLSAADAAKLERRISELERAGRQPRGGVANRPGAGGGEMTSAQLADSFKKLRNRVAKLERASGYGKVWKRIDDEFAVLHKMLGDLGKRVAALESNGLAKSGGKLVLSAPTVEITTGHLRVKSSQATFDGLVKSNKVVTKSINAQTYSPGAGNLQ